VSSFVNAFVTYQITWQNCDLSG